MRQGRTFLQEDKTCPFCQQETITDAFKKQLEEYFDETFVLETKKVKQLAADYNLFTTNLLHLLAAIESSQQNNPLSKLKLNLFSAYIKTLESLFENNITQINIKDKEPSRTIDLKDSKDQLDQIVELIKEANAEIGKHNIIVNNFEKSKKELIGCILYSHFMILYMPFLPINLAILARDTFIPSAFNSLVIRGLTVTAFAH